MANSAANAVRWKIDEISVLPNRVSVHELTYRYDRLVLEVNAYSTNCELSSARTPGTAAEWKRLIDMLSALRLVCSLLLSLPSSTVGINIQSKHARVLESTIRRAWILQNLVFDGATIETSTCIGTKNHHDCSPFVPTRIQQAESSIAGVHDDIFLEWTYIDINSHNDDDDDTFDNDDSGHIERGNNIIPIAMMTKEDLIQEENLLLQMANTPIPTSHNDTTTVHTVNVNTKNYSTIREMLCQEWGESVYIQMRLKCSNDDS